MGKDPKTNWRKNWGGARGNSGAPLGDESPKEGVLALWRGSAGRPRASRGGNVGGPLGGPLGEISAVAAGEEALGAPTHSLRIDPRRSRNGVAGLFWRIHGKMQRNRRWFPRNARANREQTASAKRNTHTAQLLANKLVPIFMKNFRRD